MTVRKKINRQSTKKSQLTKRHLPAQNWVTRKSAAILAVSSMLAAGAVAQITAPQPPLKFKTDYLGYAASISPRATYTDNIDLAPDGQEEDEVILSTLLTGSAIFSNNRLTAVFNGNLDFSYLVDNDDFRINQDVGGASTITLLDNWFYLDLAGQTVRQLVGDNARFSANANSARGQRADVHSFSVSPHLYHEFANQSTATLRYRFTQVFVNDEDSDANPTGGDFLNDSVAHEVLAAYETGALFDRLKMTFGAYGNNTIEQGSDIIPRFEYEQGTIFAEAQYALTNNFALVGAVGYDDLEIDAQEFLFDEEALSGVFWRAGFAARPGRRTKLRVEYGRRYDDDFVDARLSYDISRRFTVTAGANRSFQTRAQTVSARFRDLELQTLDFAERLREGEALTADQVVAIANEIGGERFNAQTVGLGAANNAFLQLNGVFDRTRVSLAATYEDADFGFRENETVGVAFFISRDITRRLRAYGDAFYRRADTSINPTTCATSPFLFGFDVNTPGFDATAACLDFAAANGVTNTVGGRVGVAYQLYRNLSLFGEATHTERLSKIDSLAYDETTVTGGLTLDF